MPRQCLKYGFGHPISHWSSTGQSSHSHPCRRKSPYIDWLRPAPNIPVTHPRVDWSSRLQDSASAGFQSAQLPIGSRHRGKWSLRFQLSLAPSESQSLANRPIGWQGRQHAAHQDQAQEQRQSQHQWQAKARVQGGSDAALPRSKPSLR